METARRGEDAPLLLRPEAVADALGIGRSKVYELISQGELLSVSIGRSRRVPRQAVDAFVARLAADAQGRA